MNKSCPLPAAREPGGCEHAPLRQLGGGRPELPAVQHSGHAGLVDGRAVRNNAVGLGFSV